MNIEICEYFPKNKDHQANIFINFNGFWIRALDCYDLWVHTADQYGYLDNSWFITANAHRLLTEWLCMGRTWEVSIIFYGYYVHRFDCYCV